MLLVSSIMALCWLPSMCLGESSSSASHSSDALPLEQWGREALDVIQRDLWLPEQHLYAEKIECEWMQGDERARRQPAFAWGVGVQLSALNAAAAVQPEKYLPLARQYADAIRVYWLSSKGIDGFDVQPGPKESDRYYDDNAWLVLALAELYELTGEPKHLQQAVDAFQFVLSGEDDQLGGGIYWREKEKSSKNTCANAPAIVSALRLHQITGDKKYLEIGKRLYQWTCENLQDEDSLFFDSLRLDGSIDRRKFSYNSALMIRANVLMFQISNDDESLVEAGRIAKAAKQQWVSDSGAVRDYGRFSHLLLESFLALHRVEKDNSVELEVVNRSLVFLHDQLRDENGRYPNRWSRRSRHPIRELMLLNQASVARIYWLAAAESSGKLYGMTWPKGRALPKFAAPAKTLDAIEVQSLSADERITFSALQGQVNAKQPKILLLDRRSQEGRDTWVETIGLGPRTEFDHQNKYELLAKHIAPIGRVVLYTTSKSEHYRNLAGTVAGIEKAIPMTPEIFQRLSAEVTDLELVADLTSLSFDSPEEIYSHLYDRYWPRCSKRLIVSAKPTRRGDLHHTRDIAAACGSAVVWLDNRIESQRELMRKFLGDMTAGDAIILGWYTTERSGITTASEFGIGTMPADYFVNGSVYSGDTREVRIPTVPKRQTLNDKVYIAIFISDGDNLQYAQHAMRKIWDASTGVRGQMALNWTIAPGLVDIAPGIMNYYYGTATPKDCFVTGPSGMGYAIPMNTLAEPGAPVGVYMNTEEDVDGYTRMTETYLRRSGIRVATIWDDATPMQRRIYESNCQSLYGATVHNFKDVPSVASSIENSRLRFDKLTLPYCSSSSDLRRSIARQVRSWDGKSPLFLSYQVNVWKELKPDKLLEIQSEIESRFPGNVEFVRADHYFNLFNESNQLPFNLMMLPSTSVSSDGSSSEINNIADGSASTCWVGSGETSSFKLNVELDCIRNVSRFVVQQRGRSNPSGQAVSGVRISISEDGKSWLTVSDQDLADDGYTNIRVAPLSAKFITLVIENRQSNSSLEIAELEIYGH